MYGSGDSTMSWTVWVGGGEVNSYYLSENQPKDIAQAWKDQGYEDVVMESVRSWRNYPSKYNQI